MNLQAGGDRSWNENFWMGLKVDISDKMVSAGKQMSNKLCTNRISFVFIPSYIKLPWYE